MALGVTVVFWKETARSRSTGSSPGGRDWDFPGALNAECTGEPVIQINVIIPCKCVPERVSGL